MPSYRSNPLYRHGDDDALAVEEAQLDAWVVPARTAPAPGEHTRSAARHNGRCRRLRAGEFGRSADNGIRGGVQAAGRDHNAKAMNIWFAGGGVKVRVGVGEAKLPA